MSVTRGRISYGVGSKHNPGDPWGELSLVIELDGRARLVQDTRGGVFTYTGTVVGSALERFWTALDTTDFPGEPDLAGPPGAATRSLTIGPDPDGPTAYLGSRGLSAKPGYANAFFILDTVIRQLSKDRITGVPPSESIVEGTEEVST